MNVFEAIARILKTEGTELITCFPSNALIESVAQEGIRTIMFRQERGAIMAADGYSRMNHRKSFGTIITQGGPGAENSMGGIAQSFSDNVPVLLLQGGPSLAMRQVSPNFSPVRTFESVSTYGEVILGAGQVSNVMRRAFHALRNGRPGPVIVEIPADVATQEVPEDALDYQPPKRALQSPSVGDIKDAVKLLLNAKKPLIVSGMGVLFAEATEELQELAELTEIPVYCTMPGKSSFDERHPLALGAGSSATSLAAHQWIQGSDVVFAVGSSMTRTGYGQTIPSNKVFIHNTESIEDINKDYAVDVGLPGDAKLTLQAIIDEVKAQIGEKGRKGQNGVATEIAGIQSSWMADWTSILSSEDVPINTYRVIGEMERTLDRENSIVTHDAGAPRDSIMPFYTATVPHSYVGWGKTTHLGFGIPLMIGAKLAKPDKFCINLMGDGAFGMAGLDIETAVRAGSPITTIVLNNGGMATYPGGYPTARELFGTTEMTSDYAKIAEGMGAVGITVTSPSEMAPALKSAMQLNGEGKTVLLDVHSNMESRKSKH
jgi:thiamine pyrophosphate-dependent acetolactate synthase large subunit-like protein